MLIPFFYRYAYRTDSGACDTNLSIVMWLLRGFFAKLPKEIKEAVALDGDSYF